MTAPTGLARTREKAEQAASLAKVRTEDAQVRLLDHRKEIAAVQREIRNLDSEATEALGDK